MKYDEVMWPEIILGRRGPEAEVDFFRRVARCLRHNAEGRYVEISLKGEPSLIPHFERRADAMNQIAVSTWIYRREMPKSYVFSRELAQCIVKLDRGIPADLLPNSFFGHFRVPDGVLTDDEATICDMFVRLSPPDDPYIGELAVETDRDRVWLMVTYRSDKFTYGTFSFDLRNDSVDGLLSRIETYGVMSKGNATYEQRSAYIRFAINGILYLFSQDADLLSLRPRREFTHSQWKKRQNPQHENHTTLPVVSVGWGYHGRVFSKDATIVSAHPRWQRCGKGRKQIKLVFVREHERRYNKEPAVAEVAQ